MKFSSLSITESESCSLMSDSLRSHRLYSPCKSLGQNTGVDSLSLLQGIFSTQGLNPDVLHCRQILYHLSHQGSPVLAVQLVFCFAVRANTMIKKWQEQLWFPNIFLPCINLHPQHTHFFFFLMHCTFVHAILFAWIIQPSLTVKCQKISLILNFSRRVVLILSPSFILPF